jgi:hypothetical protein
MNVTQLSQRINEARKSADGVELNGRKLAISETELAGIFEEYRAAKGFLRDLGVSVVASQLQIVKTGLGLSVAKSSMGDASHARRSREVAEVDCLLTTLKEANAAEPPPSAKEMYERYVAKVAAALDR